MGNVRVGLRQSKLGQNVEILYLNENRTEKIRQNQTVQNLLDLKYFHSKLFRIPS